MRKKIIQLDHISIGKKGVLPLIAGPCVIESEYKALTIAEKIKRSADKCKVPFIFKASYDKANRTSIDSFRGIGFDKSLRILREIKERFQVPLLSDVHTAGEIDQVCDVLDIIQIPAFLCRQTDLLVTAGRSRKIVNVKKGQFLAPWDMKNVIDKITSTGNQKILLTERGTSFGYNNLVSDFRSLKIMRQWGYPVIFDATHSVQQPGGQGNVSGGKREYVPLLARCAVAAGCDGLFMEVHTTPSKALSDGPNMIAVSQLEPLLKDVLRLHEIASQYRCRL
jgi:2-dehydro-3-deoxyphosphooctonate aldolase (KDO 8-P synthase)